MQALIVGDHSPELTGDLTELGLTVLHLSKTSDNAFITVLAESQMLIIDDQLLTRRMLDAARHLILVVSVGGPETSVDVQSASDRAIIVSHVSDHRAHAQAELGLALMLGIDRGRGNADHGFKGLAGRRIGIVGTGRASHMLAATAKALDLRVTMLSCGHRGDETLPDGVLSEGSVAGVLSGSSVVVVMDESAPKALDAGLIDSLGAGTTLINIASDRVVDLQAVAHRVQAGELSFGCTLESLGDEHGELSKSPSVLVMDDRPTDQSSETSARQVVRIVHALLLNKPVPGSINGASEVPAGALLSVRHRCEKGALAHILAKLDDEDIRVTHISSQGFLGGVAATTRLGLAEDPGSELIARIRRSEMIFEATLLYLGR